MDMTESIQPRSDQINADDLIAGPMTVTIREVINGKAEHPFDFLLEESERAYRPSKTCRRIIVAAWGADTKSYVGRRMTLYREPSIMFGGQRVGGIRVSHLSDISGPIKVMAQTTRGKREEFVAQPLVDAVTEGGQSHVTPSQDPSANSRTTKADMDTQGGSASEAAEPPEVSLRSAINAEIRRMQANQQSAFLTTWAQSHGIAPSSAAIEERFGEEARDLAALMAKYPTDVAS